MMLRPVAAIAIVLALELPTIGGASAAGVGERCGGYIGTPCAAGLWCDPRPNACGGRDIRGTCVRTGSVCGYNYQPVCGCNGVTYGNDCQRRRARAAKRRDGRC